MTVSSQTNKETFTGNGVTTVWDLPFRFFDNADIIAYLIDPVTHVTTPLVLGTDYTLTGAGLPEQFGTAPGKITTTIPVANLKQLYVERTMAVEQLTDIVNQGRFFPEVHEDVFDRLTMLIQQGSASLERALLRPIGKDYFDALGYRISNVGDPTQPQDAVTKLYNEQYIASLLATITGPINNAANVLYVFPDGVARTVQDLASKTNTLMGAAGIGYMGNTVFDRLSQVVNIKDAPFSVTGNNTTLDHDNLVAALDYAAAQGKPVIVPAGLYLFNDWIPLPDKLKMIFEPGAQWKLTTTTALGGFVCGGYTQALVQRPFTDVEIYNMDLDCNNIPNQNAYNAINGVNIKFYNPKARNVRFDPVNQGGKSFQFEGATVDGIHVYNPYIENSTIGINSHADPTGGTEVARFITYYNVVMRNVDVPFNVDGQFATPETGTVTNMSTTVIGANLFNCGRLTYPGNSGALGGGIVCGDRGFGLRISGLRLINTVAYGGPAAVFRGTLFAAQFRDFVINAPSVANVIDFTPVGYGFSSTGGHPCTIDARDINVFASIGLIAKGFTPLKMGVSRFDITIDSSLGITNICDSNAAASGTGYLDLSLKNVFNFHTRLQSFKNLFDNGNTVNLCMPDYAEGAWTPTDASGAGLVFTSVTGYYVREGRRVTANFSITFPTTASGAAAQIGGLPYTSMNRPEAGATTFSFKAASGLTTGIVRASVNKIELFSETGTAIANSALTGQNLIVSVNYFA